jgi:hypothetical protein
VVVVFFGCMMFTRDVNYGWRWDGVSDSLYTMRFSAVFLTIRSHRLARFDPLLPCVLLLMPIMEKFRNGMQILFVHSYVMLLSTCPERSEQEEMRAWRLLSCQFPERVSPR